MKALVISMSILLTAFFSFTPAFGQSSEDQSSQLKESEPQKTADANAVTDPNAVVRAEIEKFEGLGEALEQIDAESSSEISVWTNTRGERLDLALAVQEQITEEFKFLRELAVKEGAAETTAAIDGILLDRQERFNGVIEKLERETERYRRREERRREQQERRSELNRERASRTRRESQ